MGAAANLAKKSLTIEPGSEVVVDLQVRNTGSTVDQFTFGVLGDAASWIAVEPPTLSLFPGAEGAVKVRFSPPRSSSATSGAVPFAIKVDSREDPGGSVVEEGTVTVAPFTDVFAELIPRTSRGSRSAMHDLAVDNRANARQRLTLSAVDPDGLLSFNIAPLELVTEPGTASFAKVRVRPVRTFLRGAPQTRPFQVLVQPDRGAPIAVDGAMLQDAVVPAWAPKALAAAIALLVLGLVAWLTLVKPQIRAVAKHEVAKQLATPPTIGSKGGGGGGSSGGGGPSASTAPPTTGPSTAGAAGPPIDGRLGVSGGGNGTVSYAVPAGKVLQLTDVVLENPNGDSQGTVAVARNGTVLLQVSLANFRDLDYHFVSAITFGPGQKLQIIVGGCPNACAPGVYFSGYQPNAPTP